MKTDNETKDDNLDKLFETVMGKDNADETENTEYKIDNSDNKPTVSLKNKLETSVTIINTLFSYIITIEVTLSLLAIVIISFLNLTGPNVKLYTYGVSTFSQYLKIIGVILSVSIRIGCILAIVILITWALQFLISTIVYTISYISNRIGFILEMKRFEKNKKEISEKLAYLDMKDFIKKRQNKNNKENIQSKDNK